MSSFLEKENFELAAKAPLQAGLFTRLKPEQICTDSRKIRKGDFFIPIKGPNFDGHTYIENAFKRGACAAVCESSFLQRLSPTVREKCLLVVDTKRFYLALASQWRRKFKNLKVAALTGSVGKTTAKEMLRALLQGEEAFVSPGNDNNEIGTAQSLFSLNENHKYAVLEFGARRIGDIALLTSAGLPEVSCVLNAMSSHLEIFGSKENIFLGKTEIFSLENPFLSSIVFPNDDPRFEVFRNSKKIRTRPFGFSSGSFAQIVHVKEDTNGQMAVHIRIEDQVLKLKLPFYHDSFPINAAAAICIANELGLRLGDLPDRLLHYSAVGERFSPEIIRGQCVINDSYNASPESMISGLDSAARYFKGQKFSLVLGSMFELGDESKQGHLRVGCHLEKYLGQLTNLFLVGDKAKGIGEGAISKGLSKNLVFYFDSVDDLISEAGTKILASSHLFLKASNAIQLGKLVKWIKNGPL